MGLLHSSLRLILACAVGSGLLAEALAAEELGELRVDPTVIASEGSALLRATIRVPAELPVAGTVVRLYESDASGKMLKAIAPMYDDGSHGDAVANDRAFTTELIASREPPGVRYLRVSAFVPGQAAKVLSSVAAVTVVGAGVPP